MNDNVKYVSWRVSSPPIVCRKTISSDENPTNVMETVASANKYIEPESST